MWMIFDSYILMQPVVVEKKNLRKMQVSLSNKHLGTNTSMKDEVFLIPFVCTFIIIHR